MRVLFLTAALLAALAFAACGDDDEDIGDNGDGATATTEASGGDNIELVAADFQFAPAVLALAPGQSYSVTLINTGQAKHGFTVDELDVSEDVDANGEVTFDFTAPDNNVEFYCQFHPDTMVGSITIDGTEGSSSGTSGGGGGYGY